MSEDCIFCKIIKGEIPSRKVYEDEDMIAFLDIMPVNKGHALVVPKRHFQYIEEATDEELAALMKKIKKIAPAVLRAVGSQGYNLGINNGAVAGQLVPHLHFHIMPRFEGDGHHLFKGKKLSDEEMDKVKEKIVGNL